MKKELIQQEFNSSFSR